LPSLLGAQAFREAILVSREDLLLFRAPWCLGKRRSIDRFYDIGLSTR
jgi:hypothetical protein